MLGDSDSSYLAVDPVFGYILYIIFSFTTVFVLLTMMISIIGDAYQTIKARYLNSKGSAQNKATLFGSFLSSKSDQEMELAAMSKTVIAETPISNSNKMFNGEVTEDPVVLMQSMVSSLEEIKTRIKALEASVPPSQWKIP